MSDAPDQIWIDSNGGNWSPCSGGTQDVEYRRADLPPTLSAAMELPEVRALADALRVALDYVEGCKVNNLPDLGVASRLPFMDDVLKLGDAALASLAAIKEPKL